MSDDVRPNAVSLRRIGVTLVDAGKMWLKCDTCGVKWQPRLLFGGRLAPGWWKCPKAPSHTQAKAE